MKSHITYSQVKYIMMVVISFSLNPQTVQSNPARKPPHSIRSLSEIISKTEEESVENIDEASTITPESKTEIMKELEKLMKNVAGKPSKEADGEPCNTETCTKLKKENLILKKVENTRDWMLKPAYPCDEWDQVFRFCFLHRNLGNTVTFVLAIPPPTSAGRVRVEWHQEFNTIDPQINKTYNINPKDTPWNMVVGSGGHELRISPITETDIYPNRFTAVVHYQYGKPTRKLNFIIRKIPISVGLVYPGATMTLHVPSFITLPTEGMSFKWALDRQLSTLPSNMRPSPSGASLRISELRKEQEGVVACSVYTNRGVQATHVDFSIKQVESDNNQLVFVATRPPHNLLPMPNKTDILSDFMEQLEKFKASGKRDLRVLSNAINQLDQRSLKQVLSNIPHFKNFITRNNYMSKKRKKRSLTSVENLDYFEDSTDNEQAVTIVYPGVESQEETSFRPRYTNKQQGNEPPLTKEQVYNDLLVVTSDVVDPNEADENKDGFESEDRFVDQKNESHISQEVTAETMYHDISRSRKMRSSESDNSPFYFKDSLDNEPAVTNVNSDVESQEENYESPITQEQAYDNLLVVTHDVVDPHENDKDKDGSESEDRLDESAAETANHDINKNRKMRSLNLGESLEYFEDSTDKEQKYNNVNTGAYFEEESSFMPNYMSKRQDGDSSLTQEQAYDNYIFMKRVVDDPDEVDEEKAGSESKDSLVGEKNESNIAQGVTDAIINHSLYNSRKKRYAKSVYSPIHFKNQRMKSSFKSRYKNKRQDNEDIPPPMDFDNNEDALKDRPVRPRNEFQSPPQRQKSYFGDFDREEYRNFEDAMETPKPPPTRRLSVFERRRLALLQKLRERNSKRKLVKNIPKKKPSTTTESFERLFVAGEGLPPLQERDKLAILLGKCDKNSECSMNAVCVKLKPRWPGFCRCLPKFEGNGIFCWEGDKWIL